MRYLSKIFHGFMELFAPRVFKNVQSFAIQLRNGLKVRTLAMTTSVLVGVSPPLKDSYNEKTRRTNAESCILQVTFSEKGTKLTLYIGCVSMGAIAPTNFEKCVFGTHVAPTKI